MFVNRVGQTLINKAELQQLRCETDHNMRTTRALVLLDGSSEEGKM